MPTASSVESLSSYPSMPVSYSKVMFTACSMAFLMGSLAMPSWSSTLLAYCEKRMFTISRAAFASGPVASPDAKPGTARTSIVRHMASASAFFRVVVMVSTPPF